MKKVWVVLAALCALVGAERLYNAAIDGFEVHKIASDFPFNSEYEITGWDSSEVDKALNQKYTYLASGSQSYCFASNDYVIKFFKHSRWRDRPYFFFLTHAHKEKLRNQHVHAREATFESCVNSFMDFKEATKIVYVHLNKTNEFKRKLKVKDKLGRKHLIDLDTTDFVIQKRAIPTPEILLECKRRDDLEGAKAAVSKLFACVLERRKKGYNDKDPNLIKNFGFIDDTAVELDVGGFYIDFLKNYDYFYTHELSKIRKKMMPWISRNYPELIPHIDNEIDSIRKKI